MLRRSVMRLLGGAAAAPAVARAADRAEMVANRVPLPGAGFGGRITGRTLDDAKIWKVSTLESLDPLMKTLMREQVESGERKAIRRQAWDMALDPDLAALSSCSETYLRHLQEQRLLKERTAEREISWRIHGLPDWMQP